MGEFSDALKQLLSIRLMGAFPMGKGQVDQRQIGADPTGALLVKLVNTPDHGLLDGLGDDDHTIYVKLAGRATGQTIYGGVAASESLILRGTSHATVGRVDLLHMILSDAAATPSVAGHFQRSGTILYFHDATAARRLVQHSDANPSSGHFLVHNGTIWVSVAASGDATLASSGALTLASAAITGKTAITAIADDDLVLVSDTSDSAALKKITRDNFMNFATQADQEAFSSLVKPVTPGRQHYHPSAAKGWVYFLGTGTTTFSPELAYNCTAIVDRGAGNFEAQWVTDFSTAAQCSVASSNMASTKIVTADADETEVYSTTLGDVATDADWYFIVAFGDHT